MSHVVETIGLRIVLLEYEEYFGSIFSESMSLACKQHGADIAILLKENVKADSLTSAEIDALIMAVAIHRIGARRNDRTDQQG